MSASDAAAEPRTVPPLASHYGAAAQLGIDVGGTSIKGAIVDLRTGQLAGPIHSVQTPGTATPEHVATRVRQIAAAEHWTGSVGIALPGVIVGSSLHHAPNLSSAWEREGALDRLRMPGDGDVVLINDADAAGLAELTYGPSGSSDNGLTVVLTFGTGIGSALIHDGDLIANSELGGLVVGAGRFEDVASGRAISDDELTPAQWAERAQPFFDQLEAMLNPGRWVLGGGFSEKFEQYSSRLKLTKPVDVAHLGEHAGIVGAAAAVKWARESGTQSDQR
ncbi:MAG: ROK family protein [Acidimicrobiales bacterium]|nr:ROK family protein [Acidimicrobiales bacterium]MYH73389.1 ROK family protein [Acidimicrobiales bacterium]MYK71621.1 ROK family protein [Acidimicrobiales bacterium]